MGLFPVVGGGLIVSGFYEAIVCALRCLLDAATVFFLSILVRGGGRSSIPHRFSDAENMMLAVLKCSSVRQWHSQNPRDNNLCFSISGG
jgi:hypothetical protein